MEFKIRRKQKQISSSSFFTGKVFWVNFIRDGHGVVYAKFLNTEKIIQMSDSVNILLLLNRK